MGDLGLSALAQLPSIDRLLNSPCSSELILSSGRDEFKHVAQETLESMRIAIKQGGIAVALSNRKNSPRSLPNSSSTNDPDPFPLVLK